MIDETWPTCDICDEPMDDTAGRENDWNGETGNHLSCEREQRRAAAPIRPGEWTRLCRSGQLCSRDLPCGLPECHTPDAGVVPR